MTKRFESILGSSVAAALIWLASLGAANAITIRGSADPVFSGTYQNLYWTATIQFDLSATCLSSVGSGTGTGSLTVNASTSGACAVSGYSLVSDLTFNDPVPPATPTTTQTIPLLFPQSIPTITLDVSGGVVDSIGTTQIGASNLWNFTGSVQGQGYAWIQFFNTPANDSSTSSADLLLQFCTPVQLVQSPRRIDRFGTSSSNCGPEGCSPDLTLAKTSTRADVQVTQVPEPGPLALMGAAFAVGLLVRRRKQLH